MVAIIFSPTVVRIVVFTKRFVEYYNIFIRSTAFYGTIIFGQGVFFLRRRGNAPTWDYTHLK
jgi:hypothetical protein